MKKITKRIISLILGLVILVGCIPSFTIDADAIESEPETIKEINIQAGLFGYPGKTDKIILDSYLTDDGETKYSGDLDLTYESSNEDVLKVENEYGKYTKVKCIGVGTARITAKTDEDISTSINVTAKERIFSFDKENINGLVGLSDRLWIDCVPYDYNAIQNLTFISLDENVVKINDLYYPINIEYMGLGSTKIICKYEGNVVASCDINVEEPTKISVDEIVNVDHATERIFYEITPTVSGKYVINDNDNLENIYTVSNDGSLEKVDFTQNAGKTYMFFNSGKRYIICFDNSEVYEEYSFSVSRTIKASRISFEKEEMNVFYEYIDSTLSNNIIFYPDNADYETVSLKSSDESVIEILDNGEIRSKKVGTAEITATTASGLTAKCTINVLDPINVTADNYIAVEYDSNVYDSLMVYSFIPDVSGKYKIYSIGNNFTGAIMYDKDLSVLKYAESDETGGFLIEAELTAGTRYLICTEGECNSDGLCSYVMRVASPGAHDFIIGDVNGDGVINPLDRLTLSRYLANWPDYTADKIDMDAADVNCDGVVNPLDRLILSRYLANWPEYNDIPHIK